MDGNEYSTLRNALTSRICVASMARSGDVEHSYEVLLGLYFQQGLGRTMKQAWLVREKSQEFVARFNNGEKLVDIAKRYRLSACAVARGFLGSHFGVAKAAVTKMLRTPSMIEDSRIRQEVVDCTEVDEMTGPYVDRARTVMGVEYEFILMEKLRNLGLEFETEDDLRARGTHKTPDVLLCVPVAFGGRVVRWIDSKAKFGDPTTMRKDYEASISAYVGRFGPGMVVYWFGFVRDSNEPMQSDTGVLVVDNVPSDVIMLPGTVVEDP